MSWQIWSTAHPHLVELDDTSECAEDAVRAACLWNLDADGGFWFAGGIATIGVQSAAGRWSCAATMVDGPRRVTLTPMVLQVVCAAA